MKYEEARFRLTGTSPILGSISPNKNIFTEFIASKAEKKGTPEEAEAAAEDVVDVMELDEKGVSVFYRDSKSGCLVLKGYQIKGFLKDAIKALNGQIPIKSYVSKVDNYVFIKERNIPIMRDGEKIYAPDEFLERPLRADTAQGPRVALAKSECIYEGFTLEFSVKVILNERTAKSIPMTMDVVRELLSYGELKGLLQWRNAGYGSFVAEEIGESQIISTGFGFDSNGKRLTAPASPSKSKASKKSKSSESDNLDDQVAEAV